MSSSEADLRCSTKPIDDGAIVRVSGDIDYNCAAQLRNELMAQVQRGAARLVVDLSEVPYMDSSGVAVLVEALRAQKNNQRRLVLCCMQERVLSIFEISRLTKVFEIASDLDAAKQV